MKSMRAILPLILIISCISHALATPVTDSPELAAFKAKLTDAVTSKNLKELNDLFYTKDAGQYQTDIAVFSFEYSWDKNVFDNITIKPLDDSSYSPASIGLMLNTQVMNDHKYAPNLKPVYFCEVNFKSPDGKSKMGNVLPIGIAPDGSYKFILATLTP